MIYHCGENFDLNDDEEILKIVSPMPSTGGYLCGIVHKNLNGRWVVVAMRWKNEKTGVYKPCLGIRWFYSSSGAPISRHAIWYVIPSELSEGILCSLSPLLNPKSLYEIRKFLATQESENLSCECDRLLTHLTNNSGK